MSVPKTTTVANEHTFSRSEFREAEHMFAEYIKRYFGEVWQIKSDGQYLAKSWDCTSMLLLPMGLWHLCQAVKHTGAVRAAGKLESVRVNTILRFTMAYESVISSGEIN
jgi:hypothetical protein